MRFDIHIQKTRVIPSEAKPAQAGVAESRNLMIFPESRSSVSHGIPRLRFARCAHFTEFILSAVEGFGMTRVFFRDDTFQSTKTTQ